MNKFLQTATGKAVERMLYLALSAAIASVVAYLANNPVFGASTPVIYFVLKTASDILNKNIPNV